MVNLRDLPMPGAQAPPKALRTLGWIAMATAVLTTLVVDPQPHEEPLVAVGIALLAGGLALSLPQRTLPPGRRFFGLLLVGTSSCVLAAVQPDGAGFAGIYFVMVIGGMRLDRGAAIVACGGSVAALVAVQAIDGNPAAIAGLLFSVVPWFLIMRLIRRLAAQNAELRESRAAHAEAAALAERGRVARELHDVLAHSLSALALQLEGTRLLARDRGADRDVVDGLERAHKLATSGLTEARQAIAALRGDDLPQLRDLADTFPGATFTVTGTPQQPSSEAQLALYRTAQEALTNVRRHSRAERVDLRLDYAAEGTTLTVEDHGAPAADAPPGYGLTGMRERAELLGGRLSAGPTADGFRVELWLPALPRADRRADHHPRGPSSPLRS
jgi:signal transduction histidine kinase